MFNPLRVFAEPQYAVHSLEVQARMAPAKRREENQFELLVRHFLNSLFNNEMVSADGEARTYLIQLGYAIALPGAVMALYLFVPYHAPGGRAYWAQVSDRYFYVLYSMVITGAMTVFQWDLFFPGVVDIFVLSSLPIERRRLFEARIAAIGIFLFALIVGTNLLGTIFFPAASDMPSPARHFTAHFLAVTLSGIFIAAFVLASQSMLLALLGQRLFQRISPILQGLYIMVLFTALFQFPVMARSLSSLIASHSAVVRWFPPFWFLGIYERIITGPSAAPLFSGFAVTGLLATLAAVAGVGVFYPLAYQRRTSYLLEGRPTRSSRGRWEAPVEHLLHATVIRRPIDRAIYHFVSQTLFRTYRHRVYLALYGGVGLALVIAGSVLLASGSGRLRILFSADGLRAAIPIVAFWTIAGLHNAFVSPVDRQGSWIFRVICGRAGLAQLAPGRSWALLWGLAATLAIAGAIYLVGPPELRGWGAILVQVVVAFSLCLLLRDYFFLRDTTIPFTGVQVGEKTNLAFVLIQYFGLFPALIWVVLTAEDWALEGLVQGVVAVLGVVALHLVARRSYRAAAIRNARLMDVDEEEEEFPQRLGLRY
jgi:hypothetical protein